ncbi:MAG: hypothetical protein IT338_19400 [Thermomicrobiales bacterium]|nr:hypothetical protein [Thermomicrobiales bacterium]
MAEFHPLPEPDGNERGSPPPRETDAELPVTTRADIESAGRSCMVILILAAIIILIACAWIAITSTGGLR